MKLLNHTSRYFSIVLLIVIPIWAAVFYYSMLDEIYDSIDDGLDNQKGLILQKVETDSIVADKNYFDETDYLIREVPANSAIDQYDRYTDTLMYMQNEKSEEPVRMLTTAFTKNDRYYQLQIITSMVEEDDLLRQLLYSLLWLYGGLVISIVLLNNFLLRKIWKPFHQLMAQLKKYRLDKPVPVKPVPTKVDEFNMMNDTVQKLLDRNMHIYNSQKQFIENASHELQTPLAIAIAKLETLAGDHRLSEEQLRLLSGALDNLARLTKLNRSLLLLSKIENKQFPGEEEVDIYELVQKIVADFKDQSDYKEIQVNVHTEEKSVVRMNPGLAVILITNLIKNAIVHSPRKGQVHIEVNSQLLSVENTAATGPLDAEKIFDRFHISDASSSSTGLGLALVKAIVQHYQFSVEYSFNGKHRVIVKFFGTV